MKNIILILTIVLLSGCQNPAVEKPNNLIEKDKMVEILYDISLLEAVKSQNVSGELSSEEINKFIFKKHKIDSLQLVKSNIYYASDVEEYKKMYQKVKKKLEDDHKKLEKINNPGGTSKDTLNAVEPAVL